MSTAVGNKIRQLRKEKGYTLENLAELTDSSKSYIWELENKHPPRPSAEKVGRIARALGVTSDYLINDSQAVPQDQDFDVAFFRDYQGLATEDKERIRDIVEAWGKKG